MTDAVPERPALPSSTVKNPNTSGPTAMTGRLPTTTEVALIEYSKQLLLKSVETSLEFHKTMLGISATFGSAITTLVPVLVWGDKNARIPEGPGYLILVPALLMLLSSICFAFGFYPRYTPLHINDTDAISRERAQLLRKRAFLASLGVLLFCSALMLLVVLVIFLRSTG